MVTATVEKAGSSTERVTARRQTLGRAIHSEWIKIRTIRTTWIGMIATIVVLAGFGMISAAVSMRSTRGGDTGDGGGRFGGSDPLSIVLTGATFAVLLVGVIGCLAGSREYGSRLISTTASSVPRRWQIVVSKTVALIAVVVPTSLVGVFAAFAAGMAILSSGDAAMVSLADDGVLRSVIGMAFYLSAIAVIGLGLGVVLRSAAGSIGALVAGVLILPSVAAGLLPDSWGALLQYLPTSAASSFTTVTGAGTDVLGVGAGIAVLLAWVAVAVGAAVLVITKRDA